MPRTSSRFFSNPENDYDDRSDVQVDKPFVVSLISRYLGSIQKHTAEDGSRPDLYVGDAGL